MGNLRTARIVAEIPTKHYAAWRKLRRAVAVLRQACRRYVKGVDELLAAAGGQTASIYEFADGSVAYFALPLTRLTLPKRES